MDRSAGRYPTSSFGCQDICLTERPARQDTSFLQSLSLNSVPHARAGMSHSSYPILGLTQDGVQAQQGDLHQIASTPLAYVGPNQNWYPASDNGGWRMVTTGNASLTGMMGPSVNPKVMAEFAQGTQGVDVGHLSRTGGGATYFDTALQKQGGVEIYKQPISFSPFMGQVDALSQNQLSTWKDANNCIAKQAPLHFKPPAHSVVEQFQRKPYQRPRVFCVGISGSLLGGELTMSETGMLGVICSCHNLHMSVANFSEHAGLFPANPGNCILMESGDSIVQWRKAFFSHFGVKVPEDHIGWNWTDWLGKQGDNLTQKVSSRLEVCKEADFVLPGSFHPGKNSSGLCFSSVGFRSDFSNHRSSGMRTNHADTTQARVQSLSMMESTSVDKSFRRASGEELSKGFPPCWNGYNDITNRNSTQFVWGNDTEPRAFAEQASFAKVETQSLKRSNENPSSLNEINAMELHNKCRSSQNMEQAERDSTTSSFELSLGQPSQQNLSLGLIYSDSLHSQGPCIVPLPEVRSGNHELPGPTVGGPNIFDEFVHQGNRPTYTTNWPCSNQKDREFGMLQAAENNKLRNIQRVQSCPFSDMHTLQMFPNLRNSAETAVASYDSHITMQSSLNCDNNVRHTLELSSPNYFTYTPLTVRPDDITKDAGNTTFPKQLSPLVVRPTVRSSEAINEVQDMLWLPSERSRPRMGPPGMTVAPLEESLIQAAAPRSGACGSSLTTWANQAPCFTNSESFGSYDPAKLHEGTGTAMICCRVDESSCQHGLPSEAEIRHDKGRTNLCHVGPSKVSDCPDLAHSQELSRDFKNKAPNHLDDSSKIPQDPYCVGINHPCYVTGSGVRLERESKQVTNNASTVLEEQNVSEVAEEVGNLTGLEKVQTPKNPSDRALGQDLIFKNPSIVKQSCIEKVALCTEGITRSVSDAEADSAQGVVTAPELPLSFRDPTQVEKALSDGVLVKAEGTLGSDVASTAKQLRRNDVLDEGSGIGKCCSSIEADMEATTSAGPVLSHMHVQPLESQTSIANSSSSNAVISDTLSNSIRAQKFITEVDKICDVTRAGVQEVTGGMSVPRSDKRGRKALRWKAPGVASSEEPKGEEKLSSMEVKGISRIVHNSCDIFSIPTIKGLKRKRSALSGPDLTSSNLLTSSLGNLRKQSDTEHVRGRVVSNVSLRPPKEAIVKQMKGACFVDNKKVVKQKRAKYHNLCSRHSLNPISSKKKSLVSRKFKNLGFAGSSMRQKRGYMNRSEVKSVKTASLSSILEVPKAASYSKKGCHLQCNTPNDCVRSSFLQSKFRPAGDSSGQEFPKLSSVGKGDVRPGNLVRLESGKRRPEMLTRSSRQKKTLGSETIVPAGKTALIAQALALAKEMVNVPLKFIPEKRLEPDALRRECKVLLITSAKCGSIHAELVKRLQSQVINSKPVQHSLVLDTEFKRPIPNDDDDEVKPLRKQRKCRTRVNFTSKQTHLLSLVCCICGDWTRKQNNVIVKCIGCGLGMHQACYGVTKVSKKPWICRPCKVHATNIVCVLCGYGGGAMTRAKNCGALIKGLLQAWHYEDLKSGGTNDTVAPNTTGVSDQSLEASKCGFKNMSTDSRFQNNAEKVGQLAALLKKFKVTRNNVADGIDDPTVTQWVHVVCALWMPGTRCINLKTMAAFDVSGVPRSARKSLCSICKRSGGACIKCRVPKCAMPFHPWCAHAKGLLQNEAFGGEEDKVGFFGKCLLHSKFLGTMLEEHVPVADSAPFTISMPVEAPHVYASCARTEGAYKRSEKSFAKKVVDDASLGVLQEDVTAWLSKKEHKRGSRRFIKLANSDMKTHNRAYIRFKQKQGWKRLAVYKSSIHALGLYTSENISKGEMVAEYVGEVIGVRVADKREADYLSNDRLQYRGACYLFRIDEENIIDATHKGGIARFVNHSCSPNCVAKIISVEKQKKVVFFAERDIVSGEELTYDYKLDFETENRLPCYCKSAVCRGFLN